MGSRLGGAHFELTGENVTECTGGPEQLLEVDLPRRYTTYCDPRLNYAQGEGRGRRDRRYSRRVCCGLASAEAAAVHFASFYAC